MNGLKRRLARLEGTSGPQLIVGVAPPDWAPERAEEELRELAKYAETGSNASVWAIQSDYTVREASLIYVGDPDALFDDIAKAGRRITDTNLNEGAVKCGH